MRIEDTNGEEINSLEDWSKVFDTPQRKKHWKAGRSAHSIADFILNRSGEKRIAKLLERVVTEEMVLEKAIPEFEVPFDKFGRGRVHDLGVFGTTNSGKSIFIGIESKVDESFNRTVSEVYLEAKAKQIAGEATNAPARIENLLRLNFHNIGPSVFDLRYQLLYATAGTVAVDSDLYVLLILVFKTHLYEELKALDNYRDYLKFTALAESSEILNDEGQVVAHRISVGGKELFSIYENILLRES